MIQHNQAALCITRWIPWGSIQWRQNQEIHVSPGDPPVDHQVKHRNGLAAREGSYLRGVFALSCLSPGATPAYSRNRNTSPGVSPGDVQDFRQNSPAGKVFLGRRFRTEKPSPGDSPGDHLVKNLPGRFFLIFRKTYTSPGDLPE